MKRTHYINPNPVKRKLILDLLDRNPEGMRLSEIRSELRLSQSSATSYIGALGAEGVIAYGPGEMRGPHGRWHLPKHAEAAAAAFEARSHKTRLARRQRDAARARRLRAKRRSAATCWQEEMPTHRVVPADQCRPLRPAGPPSVWELAA